MDSDFYSVTAQITVVLLLAATLESKFSKNDLTEKSLFGFVAKSIQVQVLVWGVVALLVSLLHLSGYTSEWFIVGKLSVFVAIFMMLLLLVLSHILSLTITQLSKLGVAALGFVAVPMLFNIFGQYMEFFTTAYADITLINILSTLIFVISFYILFLNKPYFYQLQQIIGARPMALEQQKKLAKKPKKTKSS